MQLAETNDARTNFKLEMTNFFLNWDFFTNGPTHPWNMNEVNYLVIKMLEKIEEFTPKIKFIDYRLLGPSISFGFEWEGEGISVEVNVMAGRKALFRWR